AQADLGGKRLDKAFFQGQANGVHAFWTSVDRRNPEFDNRRKFKFGYDFDFDALPRRLVLGATLEYWLEVIDGNDVSGAGHGLSEHYKSKIVTKDEKTAALQQEL